MNPARDDTTMLTPATESSWPDDQTLLLYLLEPEQLAPEAQTELNHWIARSPEHADRLADLAEQVAWIANSLPTQPNRQLNVSLHRPIGERVFKQTLGYWTAAATILVIASLAFAVRRQAGEGSDEVALHWATLREPQTTTSVDIWSSDDFVLTLEPSASESETLDLNLVESLPSDEPAFGFSESEPPDWLIAAFIDDPEDNLSKSQ